MTLITFTGGKVVVRDGKVGTEQACCCNKCLCELDCDVVQNVSLTFYGTKNGDVAVSWPSADPNLATSAGPFCTIYGNSRQVSFTIILTEPDGGGGVRTVASATIQINCGPDAGLNDGEYFISVTGTYGQTGDALYITFSYDSISTICDQAGLPLVDTDAMTCTDCTDQANGQVQLDPCPVRVVASFS